MVLLRNTYNIDSLIKDKFVNKIVLDQATDISSS